MFGEGKRHVWSLALTVAQSAGGHDVERAMAEPNTKALYSTCVACLGFVCFAVGATAVGLPFWGYFEHSSRVIIKGSGYFGPWKVCKYLVYNREVCGPGGSGGVLFEPIVAVYIAGIMAAIGVTCLGIFCLLSVIQMAMVTQRDKVVLKYSTCVIIKLVLAVMSTLLAILAAGLFALQVDDERHEYTVRRGESFFIQILLIVLDFVLFVMSLYDVLFTRRLGGDPTMSSRDPGGDRATTFNNPHFRDRSSKHGGISMTDASGQPYVRASNTNGSLASVATVSTTVSNGSSLTRSPLRSSLKKPKPPGQADGLGIQNPGFSQGSPTMQRNGSVKKVRIQTHSTAV